MSLFFLSGGGRYGNQLVNIYHLLAHSLEYKLKVYKLNDSYFINKENYFPFINLDIEKKNNFAIKLSQENFFIENLSYNINRFLILFVHFIFYFVPNFKSLKFKALKQYNKFTVANNIELTNNKKKFIDYCLNNNVAFSGYGLRDYSLLSKHKKNIIKYIFENLDSSLRINNLDQIKNQFLFVHIRRTDFIKNDFYNKVNFSSTQWINSIIKFTKDKKLNNVVLFSDELINNDIVRALEINNIKVIIPEDKYDDQFLKLFFNYIKKASYVLCNGSSLSISLSFLFRDYIFIPSKEKLYKRLQISKLFIDPYYSYFF